MAENRSFAELKRQAKLARNAARREATLKDRIATLDTDDINARFLRKGETLAIASELEPFQLQAVLMTVRNYRTGLPTLNASDVGLGKTREAASFVATVGFKRVLWLTFNNLVHTACAELSSLSPDIVAVPIGDQSKLWLSMPLPHKTIIYVTNYEKIHSDDYLYSKNAGWDCIIADECTKLKNGANVASAQPLIWKKMRQLLHVSHPNAYRLFLSATPAENRPDEVWSYLHLFQPQKFDNYPEFAKIFTVKNAKGEFVVTYDRLIDMLGGMIIRHTVLNLGLDLPSIDKPEWFTTRTHSLNIDPDSHVGQAYLSMHEQAMAQLDQYTVLNPNVVIEVMLRLRQLLSAGPIFKFTKTIKSRRYDVETDETVIDKQKQEFTVKMEPPYTKHDAVEQLIAELQGEGEQVIVMSCFNQPLENLQFALRQTGMYSTAIINGEVSQSDRFKMVQDFQQGKIDVLFINKRAGAHGLNLQKCKPKADGSKSWPGGASHIIHMDRWFNPAVERQANGRVLRMNTLEKVTAHYFEVENSMDTVMRGIVESKLYHTEKLDAALLKETMRRATLG